MAVSSVCLQLRDHPELQPLILHDVTPTGVTIGAGAYGNIEEVAIPGAVCAAKSIHRFLAEEEKDWVAKKVVDKNIRKFIAECKIMGRLRHPNIVQFLGLWFSQPKESCVPAIVMEKMLMSLHDLLTAKSNTAPKPHIPLGLKCSILQDIARGIAYLHKQKPPVIHRDLTAANVLLNSSMVAKIADMGVARILPDKVNTALTKIPGTMVYMPPEALEDKSQYNTSIDLFSLGVVTIFVLSQEFPCDLKAPTYISTAKGLVARTELKRREKYTAKIYSTFPKIHPLIQLIESCLRNSPEARPSIDDTLGLLDQAMAGIRDFSQMNKLELLQEITEHSQQQHRSELESMQQKCDAWREEVEKLSPLRDEVAQLHQENARLKQELAQASEDNTGLARQLQETNVMKMRSQSELESMHQKCDAWREEVEKLSPLRDEVAQLHQENAKLKQELAQASQDNVGLVRQLQMFSASEKMRAKDAELCELRAEQGDKDVIENMEIEIMRLKKKVQQHQAQEKELVARIIDLQEKLEKQLEGVRPEFEAERSQMNNNIYKMLKYVKIPDELMNEEEEGQNGSPEIQATAEAEEVMQAANDSEPADLESLLSSLKSPREEATAATISDDPLEGSSPGVEDAKTPHKDPLVEAADMTSMDLGSLLSDLVAAKKRMREKSPPAEKKVVTEDIRDLMNLLSGLRKEDVFVFGMFLGVPETRLRDIECKFSDDHLRLLTKVVTAWINTCPETATWTNLVEALTEVGRRKTAQKVAEKQGFILPGVYDDGQLWETLNPVHNYLQEAGSDLVTLMDETEKLRKDVKTKDALLLQNEERLEEVIMQKVELEQQYKDTLQELKEQKMMLEEEIMKAQKALREKEADLRKLRVERADKNVIESTEIEIMHLKEVQQRLQKVQQYQAHKKDLNLEKQLKGVRPEFEAERSQMMNKMVKIPDELVNEEEEGQNGSPDIQATAETEEIVQAANDPEPADLESLLSSLKSPREEALAVTTFEDKPFVEEDQAFAESLFRDVPPFLLSQILSLPLEQWVAIEASDPKNEEKQRRNVLNEWGKAESTAKWSVLVETLVELGLRGKAQSACIEKGIPLPAVNEDGPVWCSMKESMMTGSAEVKQLFAEAEMIRSEVKSKDEKMCVKETQLEQARKETELISTNLKRVKQDLAKEMSQCTALEIQINQKSLSLQADQRASIEPELEGLREHHRRHMNAIQNLWKEQERRREVQEAHRLTFEPQQEQMIQMKEEFAEEREMLVAKLEAVYDLYTGREKPVPAAENVAPVPITPHPPTAPPGGYRTSDQLLPDTDPVVPTGFSIMDLFHPSNTFALLSSLDVAGRPLVVSSSIFTGTTLKGRGSLIQECVLTADIAAPWVVSLKIPNRGRVMVDDRRIISIKNAQYTVGDPTFEFIVRPYENKKVTFESRKFVKSFLSVDQNAAVSVREMPPDSSEVQFVVRVQRFIGPYTTQIACPFGRPSLVNELKDRNVIQLYSKVTGVYLGLRVSGQVVAMTNPDNEATHLVYCDRGLGRVSLQSYTPPLLKIKMRFNGSLTCQGEENLDNDFYLKENPDGTVVFESVPNKGRYINISTNNQTIRNFSINLLAIAKGKRTMTVTKYQLN